MTRRLSAKEKSALESVVGGPIEPLVIEAELPQQCDWCGAVAELRPYGPNGECLCFPCAMKDPVAMARQFMRRFV